MTGPGPLSDGRPGMPAVNPSRTLCGAQSRHWGKSRLLTGRLSVDVDPGGDQAGPLVSVDGVFSSWSQTLWLSVGEGSKITLKESCQTRRIGVGRNHEAPTRVRKRMLRGIHPVGVQCVPHLRLRSSGLGPHP
jgi:hypothetical protein